MREVIGYLSNRVGNRVTEEFAEELSASIVNSQSISLRSELNLEGRFIFVGILLLAYLLARL